MIPEAECFYNKTSLTNGHVNNNANGYLAKGQTDPAFRKSRLKTDSSYAASTLNPSVTSRPSLVSGIPPSGNWAASSEDECVFLSGKTSMSGCYRSQIPVVTFHCGSEASTVDSGDLLKLDEVYCNGGNSNIEKNLSPVMSPKDRFQSVIELIRTQNRANKDNMECEDTVWL